MFKFFPMGGVGYIGGNISYIELDDTPYIIDTGILFPREESLGINYLYPDLDILDLKEFKEPEYLLLTHAHEDHIGGIKHLLSKFPNIKVICNSYTKLFIEKKFPSFQNELIDTNDYYQEGLSFFNLRHSIPGVYGFHFHSIRSDYSIFFCTDFRFNFEEQDKTYLNQDLLKEYSKLGSKKLAFIDSTNICSRNKTGPYEHDLYKNLEKEINEAEQNIYITTFPSNVMRLAAIIGICNKFNKNVNLCGFSVEFGYEFGRKAGLIDKIINNSNSNNNSVTILSGSQGDLRGAFRRVFSGNDKKVKPKIGDYLMYSSKIIPGNEKSVGEMFNKASLMGLKINKGHNPTIHASGHAYPGEISKIIELLSPSDIFPIHLESCFFQEFVELSKDQQFKGKVHCLDNFKGILLNSNKKIKYIEHEAPDLRLFVHGDQEVNKGVINDRRRLGNSGVLIVSLIKENLSSLKVKKYGLPELDDTNLEEAMLKILKSEWNNPEAEESLRIGLRHYLSKVIGYKPLVFVHLL